MQFNKQIVLQYFYTLQVVHFSAKVSCVANVLAIHISMQAKAASIDLLLCMFYAHARGLGALLDGGVERLTLGTVLHVGNVVLVAVDELGAVQGVLVHRGRTLWTREVIVARDAVQRVARACKRVIERAGWAGHLLGPLVEELAHVVVGTVVGVGLVHVPHNLTRHADTERLGVLSWSGLTKTAKQLTTF